MNFEVSSDHILTLPELETLIHDYAFWSEGFSKGIVRHMFQVEISERERERERGVTIADSASGSRWKSQSSRKSGTLSAANVQSSSKRRMATGEEQVWR